MSTSANMPTRDIPTAPKLSKRALDALKKGPTVELWVECAPFTFQDGGLQKVETQTILCSVHKALLQHFSAKWKRELPGSSAKRVKVPFPKEPVGLVVGWMIGGGGDELKMPERPFKERVDGLKMLRELAGWLENDWLVKRAAKYIEATVPNLPAPKASGASTEPLIKTEYLCYFCDKPGHVQRDCTERNAIFVTKSDGLTFDKNGRRVR